MTYSLIEFQPCGAVFKVHQMAGDGTVNEKLTSAFERLRIIEVNQTNVKSLHDREHLFSGTRCANPWMNFRKG
jgi:hypothetical protein